MNLPNRLSLVRMGLVPVLVVLLALRTPVADYVALAVFAFAAFTDFLDGYIARKRKIITAFGAFMDPVADKLLVLSALVMLVDRGLLAGWFPVAVLARELLVDGLRLVAVTRGQVIPAGKLGKIKTITQIVLVLVLLASRAPMAAHPLLVLLGGLTLLITWVSGIDYLMRNKGIFQDR